jgi:hypothetical protein
MASWLRDMVLSPFRPVTNAARNLAGRAVSAGRNVAGRAVSAGRSAAKRARNAANNVSRSVRRAANNVSRRVSNAARRVTGSTGRVLKAKAKEAHRKITRRMKKAVPKIFPALPLMPNRARELVRNTEANARGLRQDESDLYGEMNETIVDDDLDADDLETYVSLAHTYEGEILDLYNANRRMSGRNIRVDISFATKVAIAMQIVLASDTEGILYDDVLESDLPALLAQLQGQ